MDFVPLPSLAFCRLLSYNKGRTGGGAGFPPRERKEGFFPMSNYFKVKEHGSTVRTEIMAGVTTFMAMAYILMVNAGMFSNPFNDGTNVLGVSYGAIYKIGRAHV